MLTCKCSSQNKWKITFNLSNNSGFWPTLTVKTWPNFGQTCLTKGPIVGSKPIEYKKDREKVSDTGCSIVNVHFSIVPQFPIISGHPAGYWRAVLWESRVTSTNKRAVPPSSLFISRRPDWANQAYSPLPNGMSPGTRNVLDFAWLGSNSFVHASIGCFSQVKHTFCQVLVFRYSIDNITQQQQQ